MDFFGTTQPDFQGGVSLWRVLVTWPGRGEIDAERARELFLLFDLL